MAEAFGVVASAAGIVGVAAQAIDGIRKLRQFCRDVRDAPEEIQELAGELEILLDSISGMEAQATRYARLFNDVDPSAALQLCRQSVEAAHKIISDLQNEIQKRRSKGSLKAAWKKGRIEAYMTKIERAKTSLALAVSTFTWQLNHHLIIEREVETLTSSMANPMDFNMKQLQHSTASTAIVTFDSSSTTTDPSRDIDSWRQHDSSEHNPGNSMGFRAQHDKRSKMGSTTKFRLGLPTWLLARSWEVDFSRASNGWTVNLRAYRTVPGDCELFFAIMTCDIRQVQELLRSERASVFDRDKCGLTILHLLAASISFRERVNDQLIELARILIECGADKDALDDHGRCPFKCFSLCKGLMENLMYDERDKYPGLPDLLRLLGSNNILDVYRSPRLLTADLSLTTNVEVVRFLKSQYDGGDLALLAGPSLEERLELCNLTGSSFASPAALTTWFGIDDLTATWLRNGYVIRIQLCSVMLRGYGLATRFKDAGLIEAWRAALDKLRHRGFGLATLLNWSFLGAFNVFLEGFAFASALIAFFRNRGYRHCIGAAFQHFVKEFVSTEGKFPECESLMTTWRCDGEEGYFEIKCGSGDMSESVLTVFGIMVGPRVEDWNILTSNPLDERAGEFWDMIEHPERAMPGAWGF